MVGTGLLLGLLLVTTFTDIRWRRIYNATTYSGMAAAIVLSAVASSLGAAEGEPWADAAWGVVTLQESLFGLAVCGAAMVACYVLFPGGVGGGDVKLVAMMGAFLGVGAGLEAMLWTFILGAGMALLLLVWRHGFLTLVTRAAKTAWLAARLGGTLRLTEQERQPLQTDLFLSPSALLAVLIVRSGWLA